MSKYTVLICDDNPAIAKSLNGYFVEEGFDVITAESGTEGLASFKKYSPDIMILDVMLPDISGKEVCREIRKVSYMPIIMLSAKGEEMDRILGLEIGADDYLTKPFSSREVVVRAKKLIRRNDKSEAETEYVLAELKVIPESYDVFVAGERVTLTNKEFIALSYLIAHAGKTMTREHIINRVWGYEYECEPRAVDNLIKRLRSKLFADKKQELHFDIKTVFGIGYRLEEIE